MPSGTPATPDLAGVPARRKPAGPRKGSRGRFIRTAVPVLERVISIIIVCLLGVIAFALWHKGEHFDPGLYSLRTSALDSTTAAVDGKAGTLRVAASQAEEGASAKTASAPSPAAGAASPAAPMVAAAKSAATPASVEDQQGGPVDPGAANAEGSGSTPAPVLPKVPLEVNLPGIKPMGDTEFYSSDDLYQKIDGRSPAYQGFNCQQLRCRSFSVEGGGSSYVDLYEYRMDTAMNAFGIFALERDPKGKTLDFVSDGYSGDLGYYFRQGAVYAQVIASDQNPRTMAMARAIAENRAKALPVDDTGLEGRRALPRTGLQPESVSYVQDNAQGQAFLKNVFQAKYTFAGQTLSYFIMKTTPAAAAAAWKDYLTFCGKYGGKAQALPDVNGAKLFQADSFGTTKIIFQRNGEIGGVVDATDAQAARQFVEQYLQGKLQ